MKHLALLAALLLAPMAQAIEVNVQAIVSVSTPTTREDGSPLAASEISHYNLYWREGMGVGYPNVEPMPLSSMPYAWQVVLDIPLGGTKTINFAATVVDTNGKESDFSPEAKKSFSLLSGARPSAGTLRVTDWKCTTAAQAVECVISQ